MTKKDSDGTDGHPPVDDADQTPAGEDKAPEQTGLDDGQPIEATEAAGEDKTKDKTGPKLVDPAKRPAMVQNAAEVVSIKELQGFEMHRDTAIANFVTGIKDHVLVAMSTGWQHLSQDQQAEKLRNVRRIVEWGFRRAMQLAIEGDEFMIVEATFNKHTVQGRTKPFKLEVLVERDAENAEEFVAKRCGYPLQLVVMSLEAFNKEADKAVKGDPDQLSLT